MKSEELYASQGGPIILSQVNDDFAFAKHINFHLICTCKFTDYVLK